MDFSNLQVHDTLQRMILWNLPFVVILVPYTVVCVWGVRYYQYYEYITDSLCKYWISTRVAMTSSFVTAYILLCFDIPHLFSTGKLKPVLGPWEVCDDEINRENSFAASESSDPLDEESPDWIDWRRLEMEPAPCSAGGSAQVYRGTFGQLAVAIKVLYSTIQEMGDDESDEEIKRLRELRHPNLSQYIGWGHDTIRGWRFLVFEYYPSVLTGVEDPKSRVSKLSLRGMIRIARELIDVVIYLHGNRMIHRDIKPSNILLDGSMKCKVCDLGLARYIDKDHDDTITMGVGTPAYMPPEAMTQGEAAHYNGEWW